VWLTDDPAVLLATPGGDSLAASGKSDLLRYGVDLLDLYRGRLSYRRVTLLWATVATALGHKVTDADVTGPFDTPDAASSTPAVERDGTETEPKSLREIALWMRGG